MTGNRGVTLIEMMIVVALIALMAGISFPSVSAGLDSVRLATAAGSVASFLNKGVARVERTQQPVEIVINPSQGSLSMRSSAPDFERTLGLPAGVSIRSINPAPPDGKADQPRRFLLLPGGAAPRITLEIANRRGSRRLVQLDPITGAPQIQVLARQ